MVSDSGRPSDPSLFELTSLYFESIENIFKPYVEIAHQNKLSPHQIASMYSEDEGLCNKIDKNYESLTDTLSSYWSHAYAPMLRRIGELKGLKAVFGGEVAPSYNDNLAGNLCVYIDTIVISDPFFHSRQLYAVTDKETRAYYIIKNALEILKYKELITDKTKNPIVVVIPFESSIDESARGRLFEKAEIDFVRHIGAIFGLELNSLDEADEFLRGHSSVDSLIQSAQSKERILFDVSSNDGLESQFRNYFNDHVKPLGIPIEHAGMALRILTMGRMGQANDLLMKSELLGGAPLIRAETSWRYFNWKLEYDSAISPENSQAMHIVKAVQRAEKYDEPWLGNLSNSALLEIRESGAFEQIREALTKGLRELGEIGPENYFRASDLIVENLRGEFEEHQKEIKSLQAKTVKFAGKDIGSMVMAGAIDIASIFAGTPTFGAASWLTGQLVDSPKLRQIPGKILELKEAHSGLRRSPRGIFFKHKR